MKTIASALCLALLATPALAEPTLFRAALDAQSEVPPNDSGGKGSIEATYDPATKTLTWSGSYSGLTGPELMAHFHGPATPGVNAGVTVPVEAKTSPFKGSATLTDAQAADLAAGKWYFNVHTDLHKGGEIRGQLAASK